MSAVVVLVQAFGHFRPCGAHSRIEQAADHGPTTYAADPPRGRARAGAKCMKEAPYFFSVEPNASSFYRTGPLAGTVGPRDCLKLARAARTLMSSG